jgi:hypothetical protein
MDAEKLGFLSVLRGLSVTRAPGQLCADGSIDPALTYV